ncbi:dTDP-glucose 4,6-dehydratase [Desulfovibrio sp. OttesenSCG-928-A18]|nr:dTDP-glucose 4,6-dehydratase [Desulfovibrio sp. OttesenSCG-928-A18]
MRILITGGCGFIGSNFIRLLLHSDSGAMVYNVDKLTYAGNPANLDDVSAAFKERYRLIRADIADAAAMGRLFREACFDAVVNFAAESHVDRSIVDSAPFIHTNILGTQTLLSLTREHGVGRFVHISTDEVYGSLPLEQKNRAFKESDPLEPNSPYSASKASADLLCRAWHETYGFPAIITRCSNNYGPCQFPEKLIPFMYARACANEPLPVYGDGKNVRDWIHVEDHCKGVLLALQKGRPGAVYNFGGNAERSNLDVVRAILSYCGKNDSLIRHVKDRPGHDRRYAMDYSRAAEELGFAPSRDFEQGLTATLDWYARNRGWTEHITSGAYLNFLQDWYGERL